PLPGIPPSVEQASLDRRPQSLAHCQLGIQHRAADFEVRIKRFTRNEKSHNLARSLENGIDARIPQKALERHTLFTARLERGGGLVTAATTNLNSIIDDFPGLLGPPHLAH